MTDEQPRRGSRTWAGTIGMAILGFIGGVLAMIVVNDLLAGISSQALMIIAPLSLPVGAVIGAVVAVLAYRRITR